MEEFAKFWLLGTPFAFSLVSHCPDPEFKNVSAGSTAVKPFDGVGSFHDKKWPVLGKEFRHWLCSLWKTCTYTTRRDARAEGSMSMPTIVVIDNCQSVGRLLRQALEDAGYAVHEHDESASGSCVVSYERYRRDQQRTGMARDGQTQSDEGSDNSLASEESLSR